MTHLLSQVQLVCAQLEDDKITVRKVTLRHLLSNCQWSRIGIQCQ
jgi:hypothetical protein